MSGTKEILMRHGLRCTRQRDTIYTALAACKSHPTAEELHEQVRCLSPGLSLATVYNTLDVFCRAGLCIRLPGAAAGAPCRFDAETAPRVHVAMADGSLHDAPVDISERMLGAIGPEHIADLEKRMGVRVQDVQVRIIARE